MNNQTIQIERLMVVLRQSMPELEQRYKIKTLGVFGSYIHGVQHKRSDLDLLVEFYEPPSLFKFIEIEHYLSDLLGVKVDLVMKDSLKPAIGKRVLSEVIAV